MEADILILVSGDAHMCEPAVMFEAHVPARYHLFNIDNQHSDSPWPKPPEREAELFQVTDREAVDKITQLNAVRFLQFNSVAHRSRHLATAPALGAEPIDIDIVNYVGRPGESNVAAALPHRRQSLRPE